LLELLTQDGLARRGRLVLPHGTVETPCFMPVGTRGTVKAMEQGELESLGAEIILGNTYHLYLRPGHDLIRDLGGLHRFIAWPRPMLTDSGGFQVFSLGRPAKASHPPEPPTKPGAGDRNAAAARPASRAHIRETGVTFRSHLDGSEHELTPELSIAIQLALGADIIMAFADCTPYPATHAEAEASLDRTLRWAERCRAAWLAAGGQGTGSRLFGIVQGGIYPDLRRRAARALVAMDLPGYAIGGVSVGEPRELSRPAVAAALEELPADKPRYLMGVGTPAELVAYAGMGIDMMDCVLPTRNARNGTLFTSSGILSIKNARFARDLAPPDAACQCQTCVRYSRAYLRHLYISGEILAARLATHHNLHLYLDTMRRLRHAIELGRFSALNPS